MAQKNAKTDEKNSQEKIWEQQEKQSSTNKSSAEQSIVMLTISATGNRIDSGTNASNVTKTEQTASTKKLKRLQSRLEMEALRPKLPPE